ncbi:MAG: hypothetical protein MUE71_07240 [Chitinophagaceae bacterium]|nr:hypothetical protein [Chitinophagaceae bacterium]
MFTKADVEAYFNGEKQESLLFMIIGVVAVLAATFLFFYLKHQWAKGAAIPVLLIGIIQLVVGYTVFSRSDEQRKDIVYKMDMNTDALAKEELPRMEKVMKNFAAYRYTEIGLLLTGAVLFVFFRSNPDKQFWMGIGAGLALQAALMLLADGLAERRGHKYLEGMKGYLHQLNHPS